MVLAFFFGAFSLGVTLAAVAISVERLVLTSSTSFRFLVPSLFTVLVVGTLSSGFENPNVPNKSVNPFFPSPDQSDPLESKPLLKISPGAGKLGIGGVQSVRLF